MMPKPLIRNAAQYDENKEQTGDIDTGHQVPERQQRAKTVFADRKRHRAKSADRGRPHDDRDDTEYPASDQVDNP